MTRLKTYDDAIARFRQWLSHQAGPDGSLQFTNPSCVPFTPLGLFAQAVGDTELLARTLRTIENRCHRDEAAFLHPAAGTLIPYRAAWMMMAAQYGEQLHLATWLERWLMRFQHPGTGGLFGTEAEREAGAGEICFDSTTNACAAMCLSGNITEAVRMGVFLQRLVELQPEPERRLVCGWHSGRGLLVEFEAKDPRGYVIDYAQPKQFLYKIGLLVRAFALLAGRTGQTHYLELAETIHRRAINNSPDVWTNTLAHKLGWSAHTLGLITGKAEYTEDACRMADHLVTLQQPDGGYTYPEFLPAYDTVTPDLKCNYGAQFTTWIAYARMLLLLQGDSGD